MPELLGSVSAYFVIRALVRRGRQMAALAAGIALLVISFVLYGLLVAHPGGTLTALLIDSAGLAITLAITQIIILRSVPKAESGIAVGLAVVLYAVGNSVGSAIAASFFSAYTVGKTPIPALSAYRLSFLVSGLAALVALTLCVPLARRLRGSRTEPSGAQPVLRPPRCERPVRGVSDLGAEARWSPTPAGCYSHSRLSLCVLLCAGACRSRGAAKQPDG